MFYNGFVRASLKNLFNKIWPESGVQKSRLRAVGGPTKLML